MYDTSLTHQSLPSEEYLRLLGIALCAFSSNNGFIIENIVSTDSSYSWSELTDLESGRLGSAIENSISRIAGRTIVELFKEIVLKRNRIIHGFRITSCNGEQILATKDKQTQEQFEISEDYLRQFIRENDKLSRLLVEYRGY